MELFFKGAILGKNKGLLPSLVRPVLLVCSYFYGGAIFVRNWFYDRGIFKTIKVEGPFVVSVGNITCGGSGKTPFVMKLLSSLKEEKVGLLSRGYRGGDEPQMIQERFTKTQVFVDPDRVRGVRAAKKCGCKVVILDDGMQHRRLKRDIDVVVVGGQAPLGEGYYLPRGLLRDSKRSLARADYVVIHQTAHSPLVINEIRKYTKAELMVTDLRVSAAYSLQKERININGQKVGVFCGIGHPEQFIETVKEQSCTVVDQLILPDHKAPNGAELTNFARKCQSKGATYLVCTEKDRVKLRQHMKTELPIVYLEVDIEIAEGKDVFEALIQRMECNT